jgi:adenylylsulfate kinase-like enzyme
MINNNFITICSFITPLQKHRDIASDILGSHYFEVFVDCPLDVCSKRDAKGLYQKAKANQITDFTGISSAFEKPENPNFVVYTELESPEESMEKVYNNVIPLVSQLMPE